MNMPLAKSLRDIARHKGLCCYLLVFVAAIFFSCSNFANAATPTAMVVIGDSGSYTHGSLPRQGQWLGLFCNDYGCELRQVAPEIHSSQQQNMLDEAEGNDELSVADRPLAIFHGLPLQTGVITTWYAQLESADVDRQALNLRKLGRWQMPWGVEPLSLSWVRLPDSGGYRYHLGNGTQKQFLFRTETESHYGGDTTPVVHWAGDLDGDGRVDLLMSLPDDNCGYDYRLYLSSQAHDGQWVGKAAQFMGSLPACGC